MVATSFGMEKQMDPIVWLVVAAAVVPPLALIAANWDQDPKEWEDD